MRAYAPPPELKGRGLRTALTLSRDRNALPHERLELEGGGLAAVEKRLDDGHANGGAIVIAVRDDGGTYGPNPATLTNVTIHDGTIAGTTSTAIHVGEPGKDNAGPAVTVNNVTISATTEKSADHGDIANESEATMTVVGTAGNDSLVASGDSDGAFDLDGGAGDDTLAGGTGDDTLTGGTGSDTIEGGGGIDTAVYAATLATASITALADVDPDTIGNQAGWQVVAGAEGTDTLTGVEVIDDGGDTNILLVGNGGFATIQAAIDAAAAGDTIMIAAGTYNESLTITTDGLTLVGLGAVEINGTFSEDNPDYDPESESLADWLKDAAAYVQGSVGIAIGAENVSISNITVKDSAWGIELLDGANGTSLTDVVLASNMYGIYKQATSGIAGLAIEGGSFSDGYIGISFDKAAAAGGDATGVTIDGTGFSNLLRKGIYVETLSDAHITGITMDDVGQWGSIGPNNSGISGAGVSSSATTPTSRSTTSPSPTSAPRTARAGTPSSGARRVRPRIAAM